MDALLTHLTALLISHPTNILYLTGFIGASPQEREAYVLVTSKEIFLLTNSLYIEQAQQLAAKNKKIKIVEISRDNPLTKALKAIFSNEKIKLGFEDIDLTVAEYQKLKQELTSVELVATRNRVENLRTYKQKDEIEKIKKACKLTDDCFLYIQKVIKPGITETEVAGEIESFFRKKGASTSFSSIVAFGKNASMPHYEPSASCKLQPTSLILIDFGAKVENYNADMTRMIFMVTPSSEAKKIYTALKNAQQTALDLLRKGERSGAKLDSAVRQVLIKNNVAEYPHSLGHGIGLAVHESPRVTNKLDMQLKPGMVFSIEPGVYVPGKLGMRIEDLVYITEDNKVEVLSKASKEMLSI